MQSALLIVSSDTEGFHRKCFAQFLCKGFKRDKSDKSLSNERKKKPGEREVTPRFPRDVIQKIRGSRSLDNSRKSSFQSMMHCPSGEIPIIVSYQK